MKKYKIAATMHAKYTPLIGSSQMLHEHTPKSNFQILPECGATNIDLWIDGSMHPNKKPPAIRSLQVGSSRSRIPT
jgi:hypothetical protein